MGSTMLPLRRSLLGMVLAVLLVPLAGCGGGNDSGSGAEAQLMPDVVGSRLDVALSDLKRVGVEEGDVEVVGGGTFGVVDQSNWTVCSQDPKPGATISAVRVVVDRSCGSSVSSTPTEATESAVETFTVPELVGMNLQEAQDLLQSLDSYLVDQEDASGKGRLQVLDRNWRVCEQSPSAGKVVKISTIVKLSSVKLTEDCP